MVGRRLGIYLILIFLAYWLALMIGGDYLLVKFPLLLDLGLIPLGAGIAGLAILGREALLGVIKSGNPTMEKLLDDIARLESEKRELEERCERLERALRYLLAKYRIDPEELRDVLESEE